MYIIYIYIHIYACKVLDRGRERPSRERQERDALDSERRSSELKDETLWAADQGALDSMKYTER